MAAKRVIWSLRARRELTDVLEYFTERNGSPNFSLKLLDKVEDLLQTLQSRELIGRPTSDKNTRVIPMDVYLIFYEVRGNTLQIISFWDNRQDEKKRVDNP